jgi:hypothetical protein
MEVSWKSGTWQYTAMGEQKTKLMPGSSVQLQGMHDIYWIIILCEIHVTFGICLWLYTIINPKTEQMILSGLKAIPYYFGNNHEKAFLYFHNSPQWESSLKAKHATSSYINFLMMETWQYSSLLPHLLKHKGCLKVSTPWWSWDHRPRSLEDLHLYCWAVNKWCGYIVM